MTTLMKPASADAPRPAAAVQPALPDLGEARMARYRRHTTRLPFECALPGRGPEGCSYLIGFDPAKSMLTAVGLLLLNGRLRAFSAAVTSNDRGWTPEIIRARFQGLVQAGMLRTLAGQALSQAMPKQGQADDVSAAFGQMTSLGSSRSSKAPRQTGWRLPVLGNDGKLLVVGSANDDAAMIPGEFWRPLPMDLSEAIRFFGLEGAKPIFAQASMQMFRRELDKERAVPGAVPRTETWDDAAYADLALLEAGRISRLVEAFGCGLDKEALAVISPSFRYGAAAYDYYAEAKDEVRTRRLQAARVFPLLASSFSHRPLIRQAIDAAQPIAELIATGFGLGKAGAKRLASCGWRADGLVVEQVAEAIGKFPPDWFPKDRKDWDAFLDVAVAAGAVMEEMIGVPVEKLFDGTKGKWSEIALKMAQALPRLDRDGNQLPPDTSRENLVLLCRQAGDVVNAFATEVLKPALASHFGRAELVSGFSRDREIRKIAASILFSGKNIVSIIEAAKSWHVHHHRMVIERDEHARAEAEAKKDYDTDTWAPLFQPIQAPNGVWIVSLTSTDQLKDEGHGPNFGGKKGEPAKGLNLCVGGYTTHCKHSGNHILSFRETPEADPDRKSGGRLSVAQIGRVKPDDTKFQVSQHYGYENSSLKEDDPSKVAMEWMKEMLALGRLEIDFAEIERSRERNAEAEMRAEREGRRDALARACGYDWKDKEAIAAAFRGWSKTRSSGSFLPKDLRSRERAYDEANPDPLAGAEHEATRVEREAFYRQEAVEKLAAVLARPDARALIDDILPSYKTVAAPTR